MNVSACRFDTPSFLSLPHFLYADPALRDAVEGMAPDPEKHSFYFSVEPVSIIFNTQHIICNNYLFLHVFIICEDHIRY